MDGEGAGKSLRRSHKLWMWGGGKHGHTENPDATLESGSLGKRYVWALLEKLRLGHCSAVTEAHSKR